MSLLILGNSYAAAFKSSVPEDRRDIVFAGGSGHVLYDLAAGPDGRSLMLTGESAESEVQQRFWTLTTGSSSPLPVSDFQLIVVASILLPPNPWHLINCQQVKGSFGALFNKIGMPRPPVSFPVYRRCSPYLPSLDNAKALSDLLRRTAPQAKVVFIPSPMVRDDIATVDPARATPAFWTALGPRHRQLLEDNEWALYLRLHDELGITVLRTPAELISDGARCPVAYSDGALGSKNFEQGVAPQWHSDKINQMNRTHKNAAYGAVIWRQIDALWREHLASQATERPDRTA